MYNAAVIGLGRIGYEWADSHYNAYLEHPEIREVYTCDNLKKADYKSYTSMLLSKKIDIVSICTPPETHAEILFEIVPFVKAIYCEKPIATTLVDADEMIAACQTFKVVLQVNHQRRFLRPKFRFSRGVLNTGTHAFDFINFYFKDPSKVDFEYVDSDEHIFELQLTGTPSVPREAIDDIIECIETGKEPISSGDEARKALEKCLTLAKVD